ncbi:hypothetical protein [Sinosporangium siamense]|uniref:Uncharacterized protein n=1 Tax=Sinosporangium siamense TaxID=1367973 RepID=A0A919RIR1_9ACTN|nr:hypothetical protein [Sinosporangium siamense]GII94558.1 hypothetical protein Ssi02_47890 [Sinosporangium siamense]
MNGSPTYPRPATVTRRRDTAQAELLDLGLLLHRLYPHPHHSHLAYEEDELVEPLDRLNIHA